MIVLAYNGTDFTSNGRTVIIKVEQLLSCYSYFSATNAKTGEGLDVAMDWLSGMKIIIFIIKYHHYYYC